MLTSAAIMLIHQYSVVVIERVLIISSVLRQKIWIKLLLSKLRQNIQLEISSSNRGARNLSNRKYKLGSASCISGLGSQSDLDYPSNKNKITMFRTSAQSGTIFSNFREDGNPFRDAHLESHPSINSSLVTSIAGIANTSTLKPLDVFSAELPLSNDVPNFTPALDFPPDSEVGSAIMNCFSDNGLW